MDTPHTKPSLRNAFELLPESTRDWLTSVEATNRIIAINKRLELEADMAAVIPRLLTHLVTKDLNPKNLAAELRGALGIEFPEAKSLAQELRKAILDPVSDALRKENILVADVDAGKETPAEDIAQLTPVIAREAKRVVSSSPARTPPVHQFPGESISVLKQPEPETTATPEAVIPETPFMLHIEKPDLGTLPQGITPLTSHIDYKEQKSAANESKPVRVKIELPQGEPREKPKSRVVHYSNLRTPLD